VTDRCPACDGPLPDEPALRGSDRLHGLPGDFGVRVCPACGSGRTTPWVAGPDLGALYPTSYNAHGLPPGGVARAGATALFRWRMWRGLRRDPLGALAAAPPGRLLDVGSGRGDLGVVMGERGWRVTGLEPSADACRAAAERGVTCVEGTLDTAAGELEGGYDAAAFLHSLEHVPEPSAALGQAHGLLRPGALVAISLPNFGSAQAHRFGTDWFHLDLPRHRSHLTPEGLSVLLERSGFQVRSVTTSSSADGLPMSLRYRRNGSATAPSGLAQTAKLLAQAPVGSVHDRMAGSGDLLHATAVRP